MRTSGFSTSLFLKDTVFSSLNSGGAVRVFLFRFNFISTEVMCPRPVSGKLNNRGENRAEMNGKDRGSGW